MSKDKDLTETLFDTINDVTAGMLGIEGSGQHMQPMSPYLDRETKTIWFITGKDTDLVQALDDNRMAHFCVTAKDGSVYACMKGRLSVATNEEKLDELWSPVAAAWFEEGRDDPKVTLLRMPLAEAAIWTSTTSALYFGYEVVRANMQNDTPDVAEHDVIEFGIAA